MIQHGTKLLVLVVALFLSSCSSEPKYQTTAFKFIKDVFIGDIIFDIKTLSVDWIKQQLKAELALVGSVENASSFAKNSQAILLVNVSPLFIDENTTVSEQNHIVDISFKLIAPANITINKDVMLKGVVWEKQIFIDANLDDFDQKFKESISQCFTELKKNYDEERTIPTFYFSN